MYNIKKFKMVTVVIDKKDYAYDNLVDDLKSWEHRLGQVSETCFKGLLPNEGVENIRLLCDVSPYGRGYDVKVEGYDIYDPRLRKLGIC